MCDKLVYCCTSKVACSSFINDGLVNFKYIKSETGILEEKLGVTGICWIFILRGTLAVTWDREEILMQEGEMCLFPMKDCIIKGKTWVELIVFTSDRPTEYCCKMVQELADCDENRGVVLPTLKILPPLDKFIELLSVCLKDGLNCRHWYEVKQQELFMILNACYTKEELAVFLYSLTTHREQDLKRFIIENCLQAKNVAELASLCGYSMGGFKRIFKEMFNESIYRWMLQQKADHLRIRLVEKDINLKVLVDELGFSSQAHFTKFCKQWLGMVPTKFIKSQQDTIEFRN